MQALIDKIPLPKFTFNELEEYPLQQDTMNILNDRIPILAFMQILLTP